uniref:Uncharacterized protein n=1 Tax=viral metagenome TaxID=1070528 RepID=A0A6M3JMM9_9ZZZZ
MWPFNRVNNRDPFTSCKSGYDHDGLWVDDDFGCVQWEREDKQTRMVVELHAGGEACRFKAKKEYVKIPAKGDNPPGAGSSL